MTQETTPTAQTPSAITQDVTPSLPERLQGAKRRAGYDHLFIYELGATWALCFHHGKANEVGSAVLDELEKLAHELSGPEAPISLISLSTRKSARGRDLFIAGADVTERAGWSDAEVCAHVRRQRAILNTLRHAPVFHLCVINGLALGWGTEYLITADYKIASPEAAFALPETGLGILPGAGGTSELSSLIGLSHALRLGMTGERIDADEALRINLVQERAESVDACLERAFELADLASSRSPTALANLKRAALASVGLPASERAELEARAYERCVETGEAAIGRAAFAAIRRGETPEWGPKRL